MKNYIICNKKPNIVWISDSLIEDRFDTNPFRAEYIQDEFYDTELYKTKSIEDFLRSAKDLTGGATPLGANYLTEGVRFIRTQDVDYNWIETENAVFISEEDNKKLKRSVLEINDVLLTITGVNFGKSAPVRKECLPANISQHLVRMHFKDNLDAYYVSTFLNCIYGQKQILKRSVGVTRPAIDYSGIKSIIIPIPSPEIQKYIGDKVRKAEELREEAKRLKKEAEEILNAELKLSYFNERVKDAPKMYNWIYGESIEIRIDSQYYINETNFINNEMYKKGLKLKRISEIANVGKGFSYTSLNNKSIPYIRISDLDDLLINFDTVELVDEKTYLEKKSSQLEQCDLIFAITGATIGKVSLFYTSKHSKATLSSDTAFIRLKDKNDAAYVLLYLKSFIGQLSILKGVTGATNRHLSLEHIGDIFIPVIDNKLKREINMRIIKAINNVYLWRQLIQDAKQDVEDLIEGNFDMPKVKA